MARHQLECLPLYGASKANCQQANENLERIAAQSNEAICINGVTVPKWRVRWMANKDVDEVLRIQRLCYEPEYRERPLSYYERIRLFPQGNVVIEVPTAVEAVLMVRDEQASSDTENDDRDDADSGDELSNDGSDSEEENDAVQHSGSDSNSFDSSDEDDHDEGEDSEAIPDEKHAIQWRIAGYIQAQPFLRDGINDVNDLTDLEGWLKERSQLERTADDVIYVHEIAMDPAFRGKGLTVPLTTYVDQLTKDEGFGMVTLVSLETALGFWKRNGFILCRELDYGGHMCYYMEKPLPAH